MRTKPAFRCLAAPSLFFGVSGMNCAARAQSSPSGSAWPHDMTIHDVSVVVYKPQAIDWPTTKPWRHERQSRSPGRAANFPHWASRNFVLSPNRCRDRQRDPVRSADAGQPFSRAGYRPGCLLHSTRPRPMPASPRCARPYRLDGPWTFATNDLPNRIARPAWPATSALAADHGAAGAAADVSGDEVPSGQSETEAA
jgi:hypothetical protein